MKKKNDKDWEPKTLKAYIEQAGYTQRSLSKITGIPETTINSWVSRKVIPRADSVAILARVLNISFKTLYASMDIDVTGIPNDKDTDN
jgi:lambda repressor-like predicted transcriptional regulator